MYLIKLDNEQMKELYFIREREKRNGNKKTTIAGMVREAVDRYIKEKKIVKDEEKLS